jgi:hypothetical protein
LILFALASSAKGAALWGRFSGVDSVSESTAIAATRLWIRDFVIGLNLCPFAKKVFDADRIRFVMTDVIGEGELLDVLGDELKLLVAAPREQIETTILIHPRVLTDFRDYNDFLDTANRRVKELGLYGVVQIASFHPHYQFADTDPDDVTNFTNRSPYPMLHLIREASITEVAGDPEVLLGIPQRNMALLRDVGSAIALRITRTSTALSAPGSPGPIPGPSRSTLE